MQISPTYVLTVLLVFVRIGGLLVSAPFFSRQFVPVRVKVLLSVLLAYTFAGLVEHPLPPTIGEPVGFILGLLIEATTGLVLGFAMHLVFWAVQFAGEIMGFQMGLSLAQAYNPISGGSANPAGRFLSLALLLVFLLLDGHHLVLQALADSFVVVPLAGADLAESGPLLLQWTGAFFTTALRLAAPFMITIFLIDVALGVFARVVPQADLFSLSLPLKLLIGLGVFYFFLQNVFPVFPGLIDQMAGDGLRLLEALQP